MVVFCGHNALLRIIFASLFLSLVIADIMNRTIDDTFGDSQTGLQVTYLPRRLDVWKNQNCVDCRINPDVANAFNGTYTAATYIPSYGSINITMQFNGTAIYVFFILVNGESSKVTTFNTLTLANFMLDENPPQLFQHVPNVFASSIEYNQLVFSQTNLINAQHTLVIATSGWDEDVYVNFDYAIYTHDSDDAPLLPLTGDLTSPIPTSANATVTTSLVAAGVTVTAISTASPSAFALGNSSKTRAKASLAGAIAGGVILSIALIPFSIFFYLRRRRIKPSNVTEGNLIVTALGKTTNYNRPGQGGEPVEEEIIMSDVREKLRSMKEKITYLQDQLQHSVQPKGFSDHSGYTTTETSSAYSSQE